MGFGTCHRWLGFYVPHLWHVPGPIRRVKLGVSSPFPDTIFYFWILADTFGYANQEVTSPMRLFAPIGKIEKVVHGRVIALEQILLELYCLKMLLYMYAHLPVHVCDHWWTLKNFILTNYTRGISANYMSESEKWPAPRKHALKRYTIHSLRLIKPWNLIEIGCGFLCHRICYSVEKSAQNFMKNHILIYMIIICPRLH